MVTPTAPQLRRSLLDWYDQCRRELPWRAQPGEVPDAYAVWLSEIMLQQTTVATVAGYWRAFLDRWPRVEDLARAAPDDVMHAWQGLGYYARARNLHACAKHVANVHDGRFPADEALLRGLPGIGDYTAAAIAAIAYGRPAVPVDGNVVRVLARMHALPTPLPAVRTHIMRLAETLVAADRSGDFAQALMDLGATVCTPRRPRCPACPWRVGCAALAGGAPEAFPRIAPRGEKPVRWGIAFWAERSDGAVLVRKRPPRGLLGGMVEFPSTPWRNTAWAAGEAIKLAPVAARWGELPGEIRHTFTHFHLRLKLLHGRCADTAGEGAPDGEGEPWWCVPADFPALALPTLMKKIARLVTVAGPAPSLPLEAVGLARLQES